MKIQYVLNGISGELVFDVGSYAPHFESGVKWRCIGDTWHGVDYGASADHYSTTVTVLDTYSIAHSVFDKLRELVAKAILVAVIPEEGEKIFGHEFRYGPSEVFSCYISNEVEPFISTTPEGREIGEVSFTLHMTSNPAAHYIFPPGAFPNSPYLSVQEVTRSYATQTVISKSVAGVQSIAGGTAQRTFTLKWSGPSELVAQAKLFLVSQRVNPFSLSSTGPVSYFSRYTVTQNVYFFDMVDSGSNEADTTQGEVTVTYLLAD